MAEWLIAHGVTLPDAGGDDDSEAAHQFWRSMKYDYDAVEWAVALLEIHDGVKVNPNSQYWLNRLRGFAQSLRGAVSLPALDVEWDNPLVNAELGETVRAAAKLQGTEELRALKGWE